MMFTASTKLAPPWITYVSELEQMFLYDPEVHVLYDNDEHTVRLYIDEPAKATALSLVLPAEKQFGPITLIITVIPANGSVENLDNLWEAAFHNNPVFSFTKRITGVFTNPITYVVFKNKVVQYFNDDLSDVYGNCSTLYQNIAADIFNVCDGTFFCTDTDEQSFGYPLGEWP